MSLLLPRILIVDHFDSYTLNLLSLLHPHDTQPAQVSPSDRDELTRRIADRVIVLPHTHPLLTPAAFHELVRPHIDAIILSPGPGSPDKASDFGAAETLLRDESLNLPVFGVCLGHQGLAIAFGGQVIRAASVRHGLQSKLKISSPSAAEAIAPSILRGVPQDALVIRYNSLVVDPSTLPDCLQVTAWSYDRVSTAPPPRPGTTRKHSMPSLLSPQPLSSEHVAPLKHRDLASLSRSPSTVPFSSRDGSERLSEVGDMPLSEATSIDEIPEVEAAHAPEHTGSPTIMALQHKTLPFHGVQFHPESIESHWGHTIMTNYLDIVRQYWTRRSSHHDAQTATDARSRVEAWDRADLTLPTHLTLAGERCLASNSLMHTQSHTSTSIVDNPRFALLAKRSQALPSDSCVNMTRIFDQHFRHSSPAGAVWLDSARMKDPHSRYSFMAAPSFILSYKDGGGRIVASGDGTSSSEILLTGADKPTLWSFMNELQAQLRSTMDMQAADGVLDDDQQGTMFRTGFTGYWGYEMKNESLDLETRAPVGDHADAFDAEFLYCPRVLAFDHHLRQWIAFALVDRSLPTASLRGPLGQLNGALEALQANSKHWSRLALDEADATAWMQDTLAYVLALCSDEPSSTAVNAAPSAAAFRAAMPLLKPRMLAEDYMDQIESARELIAAGESYELCMTNQFQGRLQSLSSLPNTADTDHFDLYCKLRARNPAPYSAFIRLPSFATTDVQGSKPRQRGRAILSTSPERFMRITADGHVEMKPIKGTLARAGFGPGEQGMRAGGGATWEEEQIKKKWREAEDEARRAKLSADIKERAENLMIVDLIRADLFSFCHSDSVAVPKLMQVESYETVHQLVTTVTGQLKSSVGTTEAIRRCFPPGSMTGAPKRRSVQLLERLELNLADAQRDDELRARRGIYSGALGWLGCDGAADFSVVIRTLIADGDDVSIGAGGAITYLSDAKKEWQEVLDKVTALANIEA